MRILIIAIFTVLISCKTAENTTKSDNSKTSSTNSGVVDLEFKVLQSGTNGGFTIKSNQVITDNEAFSKVWGKAFANDSDKKGLPEIDFEKKMILVVAMGEQNSGGYKIEITSIKEAGDGIGITVLESKPGKTCMNTSVMTYPYHMVVVNKSDKKVAFKSNEKIIECKE